MFFSGAVEDCEKVCDPKDKENRQCETKELMTKVSIIARSLSNTLLIAKCDGQTADMIAVDAVYPKKCYDKLRNMYRAHLTKKSKLCDSEAQLLL